ncbi:MAG: D-glycerate dehydrogenase [Elioraea sp.]|nr:D-glycerate dehydrogenase [Elioraea sp.]
MPPPAKAALLLTRRLPPAVMARARRDYAPVGPEAEDLPWPRETLAAALAQARPEAVLCAPGDAFDAAMIAAMPASVRILATFSAGTDHIDLDAARARGLVVTNTPDVLTEATAELTLALILAAARRLGEGERLVRSGAWQGWTPTQLLGLRVSGKRLGILGMGRIGRALARMARGLRMEVHYHNRRRLDPALEEGAVFHAEAETMLAAIDILALTAPGSGALKGWLNGERIALLPRGAIVVNTGRGSLVDDAALIAALRSGHLAYAGLDVYDGEPALHPGYLELSNVVLMPHLGSATVETRDAMGFRALDNLDAFFAGRDPPDRVA